MDKIPIYLADLTHEGIILASNVFPLSIGLIGSYILDRRSDVSVELYKYPEDFSAALEAKQPAIVGFANYSWNWQLEYGYIKAIKKLWPKTIVVAGGPNYGLEQEEIDEFWKSYPLIDFYIVKEGEEAFVQLVEALTSADMDAERLKAERRPLKNCHYRVEADFVLGSMLPRLEIEEIPSPYLTGLMDKFFDEHLTPMIHTTRGCPFKCAFCTEGNAYYNIVSQRLENLSEELHYVSKRVRGPRDLLISDANFAMYKQDFEKARILAECQETYDYPRYVIVSTGKNLKERVIQISQILNGGLNLAASLQSTDPTVLENVRRSNIAVDKLAGIGLMAGKVDTGTYSELILGLPGDNINTHRKSLRDTVEANFDNIRMYQLIMLPQTELNTPDNRRKYGMRGKYRIMPRSFGHYSVAGLDFVAVESEEILIESDSLPHEDYVTCREMDLTIEILHNGKVFEELQAICKQQGMSWFDFIMRFFERRRTYTPQITALYDEFREGSTTRLWDRREDLEQTVTENIDTLLKNERGTNEMSVSKATAFFQLFGQINGILFEEMRASLTELGLLDETMDAYIDEMERFSFLRKSNLFRCEVEFQQIHEFDLKNIEQSKFDVRPEEAKLPEPRAYVITHSPKQREQITVYIDEFGNSPDGLGKMLMRYPHVHRIFRRVQQAA